MAEMRADSLFAFTASLANSLIASGAWARANSRSSPITGGRHAGLPLCPFSNGFPIGRARIAVFPLFSVANLPDFPLKETSSTAAEKKKAYTEANTTQACTAYVDTATYRLPLLFCGNKPPFGGGNAPVGSAE